jgi:beta-lactamase regulating signal transducer with metallopeptidase domain
MAPPELNSLAQMLASRIVDCLVEGTAIAIFAAGLLGVRRRLSSQVRFAVGFSVLMAIALLAVLGDAGWPHGGASTAVAAVRPIVTVPGSWALYILVAWAGFAVVLLARVASGVWHVFRLRTTCVALDLNLVDVGLREALEVRERKRRVALCTSDVVQVPTAIGFVRPAVVLPSWLIGELSPAELKQLVLHELAHLDRWDDWTNLAQKIVKALLFFHPAVWWIEKRVSLEREMACDAAVVAETANPRAYAECLAHLAERSVIRRGLALAQAAVGRVRQTSLRVARILSGDHTPTGYGWKWATSIVAGFAAVCAVAVSVSPRLIAFVPEQPRMVAAQSLTPAPVRAAERNTADESLAKNTPAVMVSRIPKRQSEDVRAKLRNVEPTGASYQTEMARLENKPGTEPSMVQPARWTEFSGSMAATQAVYVVVESREYLPSGQVLCRATVWRIMLMPAADNPETRVPRKQT